METVVDSNGRLTDAIARYTRGQAPLEAEFQGDGSITTTSTEAEGPFEGEVTVGLRFNGARTRVTVVDFRPIVSEEYDTPVGTNVTTVSMVGGGDGTYADGRISLPITLRFTHSLEDEVPFVANPSDLSLTLSTSGPGSPVSANGNVTLVGTGLFEGGFLGGAVFPFPQVMGTVTLVGRIDPSPEAD